jgi:hypothetical protein
MIAAIIDTFFIKHSPDFSLILHFPRGMKMRPPNTKTISCQWFFGNFYKKNEHGLSSRKELQFLQKKTVLKNIFSGKDGHFRQRRIPLRTGIFGKNAPPRARTETLSKRTPPRTGISGKDAPPKNGHLR